MQRLALIVCCLVGMLSSVALAGTYPLTDGTQISGEPISYNEEGVVLKTGPDTFLPRTPWSKFTQEALRQLHAEAKTAQDRAILDPMIEDLPSEKAKRKTIEVKPIETPGRPSRQEGTLGFLAIFSSPLGWTIFAVLYAANLFAAYEVAVFRQQPLQTVVGLAALPFIGVASPIIFLSLPNRVDADAEQAPAAGAPAEAAEASAGAPAEEASAGPMSSAPSTSRMHSSLRVGGETEAAPEALQAQSSLPAAVVFRRGDFSFNRRFFETKLAGFFRLVPSEADKDMVLYIQSGRGEFVGKRITRVTPGELYLQIFKNDATADEMIPFVEINEVQIRHKDLA